MSVGGILQNSLSQPSHYLDMKLHRWGFISPGSHCLLMIIQVGGNLHAVTLLTIFPPVPRFHLLYITCELLYLIRKMRKKYWRLSFTRCVPGQPFVSTPPVYPPLQNEIEGGQAVRWKVTARGSVLSNQWGLMRGPSGAPACLGAPRPLTIPTTVIAAASLIVFHL